MSGVLLVVVLKYFKRLIEIKYLIAKDSNAEEQRTSFAFLCYFNDPARPTKAIPFSLQAISPCTTLTIPRTR